MEMKAMAATKQLKDWDIFSPPERNVNLPISFQFSNFSSTSKNVNSLPAIKNKEFPPVSLNSGFLTLENDNGQITLKNKDSQCVVPDKKPAFHKPKSPIAPVMEKFISSATDLNILKSVRTYAKRKESISSVADDTLNYNVDKLTAHSSSDVTNVDTVKRNASSPFKHTNGYVDSEDNVTSKLSTDVNHCLFSDIFLYECNSNAFECSNNLESSDSVVKEQETSEYNNGYLRTRKNLKRHLGRKRKTDCCTESSPKARKSKTAKNISKASSKNIVKTDPPLKNSKKSNKVNDKVAGDYNETRLPIVLQESDTLKKVEFHNSKEIAPVSSTKRKPGVIKSLANDTNTQMGTYSSKSVKKKVCDLNPVGLCKPTSSKEHISKINFSNHRTTPVQSCPNKRKSSSPSNKTIPPVVLQERDAVEIQNCKAISQVSPTKRKPEVSQSSYSNKGVKRKKVDLNPESLNIRKSSYPRKQVSVIDIAKELVCSNKTGLPILLQESDTVKKVEIKSSKAIVNVSLSKQKPDLSKSPASDTGIQIRTYSNVCNKRKIDDCNSASLCMPSSSNGHVRKNNFANRKSSPVQSRPNERQSSCPRKQVSVLDIAKTLTISHSLNLQSQDSTPTLNNSNVIEHPALETNFSKKCNLLSNKVDKLKSLSYSPSKLPVKVHHLRSKDCSTTVSDSESRIVEYSATKNDSLKKCNLNSDNVKKLDNISSCEQSSLLVKMPFVLPKYPSPTSKANKLLPKSIENHSTSSNKKEVDPDVLSTKEYVFNYLAEIQRRIDISSTKSISLTSLSQRKQSLASLRRTCRKRRVSMGNLYKSANSTSITSLSQRKQLVTSRIKTGRKRKAISFDEDLSNHPEYSQQSNSMSLRSNMHAKDIEVSKKHPLVKQSKKLSAQKHPVVGNTERNGLSSDVPADTSVLNFTQQNTSTSPKNLSTLHVCSKTKLLYLPLFICDCNNPNTSKNDADLLSLRTQINNFALWVASMARRNPQELQSVLSDSGHKTFCQQVEKLFLQSDTESNCVSQDCHLPKTNSSATKNELWNPSLGASCNIELKADHHKQSTAIHCKLETKSDQTGQQTEASDLNYDLDSEINIQSQNKTLTAHVFDEINSIQNSCFTQLMYDHIGNCDDFDVQVSVKYFCENPQTVEIMSKFLSESDENISPSSTIKLQYVFPVNFQDLPLVTIIHDYIDCFIDKIDPLNCESITSQSVLDFANENMSVLEIYAISKFFNGVRLLKITDFLTRFTYVAIVIIYREYQKKTKH